MCSDSRSRCLPSRGPLDAPQATSWPVTASSSTELYASGAVTRKRPLGARRTQTWSTAPSTLSGCRGRSSHPMCSTVEMDTMKSRGVGDRHRAALKDAPERRAQIPRNEGLPRSSPRAPPTRRTRPRPHRAVHHGRGDRSGDGQRLGARRREGPDIADQTISPRRALAKLETIRPHKLKAGRHIELVDRPTGLQRQILDALRIEANAWSRARIS